MVAVWRSAYAAHTHPQKKRHPRIDAEKETISLVYFLHSAHHRAGERAFAQQFIFLTIPPPRHRASNLRARQSPPPPQPASRLSSL